ncbi:Origin recognition complex, subunit 2 [Kalmanozyma brasiliensis GHG001]|uniref:Origin recognition complex subunit 2 n=1 Tax=Kalmanozyma brasiliensis (strain GHG001) TaxID=1365824 RepID=V5E5Z8_KALBG|nr:Origin recognition complex, subunit 2 [Kalmanozyma brasiliensis GHG001]EST05641.1 Origin recognition complex, subunit 2 [Kalmanozyma brasiliensis GHG001]
MARQPAKRRKVASQNLDVEGDNDWQSDELSSLGGSDDSASGSGSDSDSASDDESSVTAMLAATPSERKGKARATSSGVEVVIPLSGPGEDSLPTRKRGRPKKEGEEEKIPKKRGRPRKYAEGEKRPRRSRRKLNEDGSPKKRGRPKKVVDPDAVMMKVPKRKGRPPKPKEEGDTGSKKKKKREFDLLAGLDLDFDDEVGSGIVPGVGGDDDDDDWEDEADSPRKQDDILARLRRRILYRQQDAELADFVERLGPDGRPKEQTVKAEDDDTAALQGEERVDEGPRPALPAQRQPQPSDLTATDKRKERQPFEPSNNDGMSALAEAAASAAAETEEQARQAKPKGRPPGSKNRRPDWEHNPLLAATRAHTNSGRSTVNTSQNGTSLSLYGAPPSALIGAPSGSSLVKPTSSDAYFLFNTSKRARGLAGMGIGTSSSLISSKLPALDARNLERVVADQTRTGSISDLATRMYRHLLPVYLAQLLAGYSIIFHGVGSKVKLLNELVARRIEAEGDAVGVVAQGAMKGFKVEDMLAEIERAVGLGSLTLTANAAGRMNDGDGSAATVVSTLTAARAERIVRRFSRDDIVGPTKLFLILETFDAPGMQSLRFKSVLETLARSSNIHIMATTEHVNSGFIASTTGQQTTAASADKTALALDEDNDFDGGKPSRNTGRLCWIWQNMSTFTPSLDEMLIMRSNPAFASWMPPLPPALDLIGSASTLTTRSTQPIGAAASTGSDANVAYYNGLQVSDVFRTVSEASAISILKSVTTKARALFNLLAKQSLASESSEGVGGVVYAELLNKAKRSFLVSNEADFKSLLIEFKDHHLCHVAKTGVISIGLADAKVLGSVLERLKSI